MKNILYLFLLILCACSSSDNRILVKNSGEAQGAYYHIQYMSNGGKEFYFQIDSIFKEKNAAKQVAAGQECGITLKDFGDFKEKDVIEVYKIVETERRI